MSEFRIVREVGLSPEEAFARVTQWEAHGEHVPLTTITSFDGGFVARTGLGPMGFDDPMEITAWDPPRHCRLQKRGRVVTGWAEIDVEPLDIGCRVVWREVAHTTGVPAALGRVEAAAGRALFSRVLDRLLRT